MELQLVSKHVVVRLTKQDNGKAQQGIVTAIGRGVTVASKGAQVVFDTPDSIKITDGKREYTILHEDDIMGIITKE